jgi:hypothetical protein
MKRLYAFLVLVITGAMFLAACGGSGGGSTSGTSSSGSSSSSGGAVKAGASGIKDASLIGQWYTSDGGSGYNFKDDFSVAITDVGSVTQGGYNITTGGNGSGSVEIGDTSGSTTWTYTVTNQTNLDLTTPDGRAKKLKKNS